MANNQSRITAHKLCSTTTSVTVWNVYPEKRKRKGKRMQEATTSQVTAIHRRQCSKTVSNLAKFLQNLKTNTLSKCTQNRQWREWSVIVHMNVCMYICRCVYVYGVQRSTHTIVFGTISKCGAVQLIIFGCQCEMCNERVTYIRTCMYVHMYACTLK